MRPSNFFAEQWIPVILPLKNNQGKTYCVTNWEVYAVFPFVKGHQYERLNVPKEALMNAGKLLARFHLLTKDTIPLTVRKRKFILDKKKAMEKAEHLISIISRKKRKDAFDRRALTHLKSKLDAIKSNAITFDRRKLGKRHVIHGDYHEANMFFDKQHISHLFDWEMVSRAPRMMELARALDFFCFYGHYELRNFLMANTYLKAYCSVYPVDREELVNGLKAWFYNKLHSMWSFEEYYIVGREDSKQFVEKEFRAFDYYRNNSEEFLKSITEK